MAKAIKKYTADEYRNAKKMKFKAKKPKKPKASATLNSLESYIERYNNWVDKIKAKSKDFKTKESDKKKIQTIKKTISGI